MENKSLTLPKKKYEYGYELAFQLASEKLAKINDIKQQCLKSGAKYLDSQKAISIEYLNQPYLISLSDADVSMLAGKQTAPIKDQILILHYFTQAKGTPLSHKIITYKELKEGINYFPVFYKRAIKPIVSYFGHEPHSLLDIGAILGGDKADCGDVAITIKAFSRLPVTIALWQGDEELAPEGSIMFDSTISDYLTNDDIHALCETITWRLVKLLKTGGDKLGKR